MPGENCTIIAIGMAPKLPIQIPVTKPIDRSLSNPKWDKTKVLIGEKVKLSVQLKKQYANASVEFKIFPEKANVDTDKPLQVLYGRNISNKSEVEWHYEFVHDPDKPLKEKPKFIFTAESFGCQKVKSAAAEYSTDMNVKCIDAFGNPIKNADYKLLNKGESGKTDGEGKVERKDVIPGEGILLEFPK